MSGLHMIELRPDIAALMRFIYSQGLDAGADETDLGYGVHAWMGAAFGELAPKPWRLFLDRRRPPRILAYAGHDAGELQKRMREFAEPGVYAVCPDPDADIASRPMPDWKQGRRLVFEVLCCPVGRKSRSGVEKDLFLIKADTDPQETLQRDAVYCDWARERLQRNEATTVRSIRLNGFRLVQQSRRAQRTAEQRGRKQLVRPHALVQGELVVNNPETFTELLVHGIGRHRAFGYGMLLLKPPS
ncbi:MAG: type I-E CRISPR-associated protein Cas6/Cse3/CasE [Chloroflexota bacterium]